MRGWGSDSYLSLPRVLRYTFGNFIIKIYRNLNFAGEGGGGSGPDVSRGRVNLALMERTYFLHWKTEKPWKSYSQN